MPPGEINTHNPSKQTPAEHPRLRQSSPWDQHFYYTATANFSFAFKVVGVILREFLCAVALQTFVTKLNSKF
jgi:hypothetical protein